MTTLPKPNVKAEYERNRIIECAARVFLNLGYDGTTMDHIAREMQVTKGFIYYYFTSKAEVFYELHSRAVEDAMAFVRERIPAGADPVTKLRRAIAANFELTMHRQIFGGVALRTAWVAVSRNFPAQYRRRLMEQRDTLYHLYAEIIQEGMDSGVFRRVDVSAVIHMVMGALTWMPAWYRADGRLNPDDVAGILGDMFLGPLTGMPAGAPVAREGGV